MNVNVITHGKWAANLAAIVLFACLAPASTAQTENQLRPGDLVAVCGDSITEQKIYSLYIEDYLLMCQPAPQLEAMQFGWSGESTWGFLGRMKNEVLAFQPTIATTCCSTP
jgi:hypothetical protein